MAYTPKYASNSTLSGRAQVQMKKDKVRVLLRQEDSEGNVSTIEAILKAEDCPSYVTPGTWFVKLSGDKKKMYSLSPIVGMFTGKVKGFVSERNKPPAPRTFVGKDWSFQHWTALIEIMDGKEAGMVVPLNLRYHFTEIEEDEKEVVGYSHPKSKYTAQLAEFMDTTGAWVQGPMLYKDNILPDLEARILRQEKTFRFTMKDGYFSEIYDTSSLPDEEEMILQEIDS